MAAGCGFSEIAEGVWEIEALKEAEASGAQGPSVSKRRVPRYRHSQPLAAFPDFRNEYT